MDSKTALMTLMIIMIALVVITAALGVLFIIALRKRRPLIKVVMAPKVQPNTAAEKAAATESLAEKLFQPIEEESESEEGEDDDEEDAPKIVVEGHERVRYNRSFTAKVCQLNNETKEWYSILKNELLSYDKMKVRVSWKRESYYMGRTTVAKLVVRGKTLCLLLAVDPVTYKGTKYAVEDISETSNSDTPTLYRIKNVRRLNYAKEMLADMMNELKTGKNPKYQEEDFYMPYEGDMSLMLRGLVKRVVTGSKRVFKVEEVNAEQAAPQAQENAAETNNKK